MHERLKEFRAVAGMTQQQLADALSYDRVHYGYIEAGQRPMVDGFYARAIAKMLKHCEDKTRLLRAENERC